MARSKERGKNDRGDSAPAGMGPLFQVGARSFGQELVMGSLWWPPGMLSEGAISSGQTHHCSCWKSTLFFKSTR